MQEDSRANQRFVGHGDKPDGRADTRAHNAQFPVTLRRKPRRRSANVNHRLPIGLQREADVRADQIIGTLVSRNMRRS